MFAEILTDCRSGSVIDVIAPPGPLKAVALFDKSSSIYGLELCALLDAIADWEARLMGIQITP